MFSRKGGSKNQNRDSIKSQVTHPLGISLSDPHSTLHPCKINLWRPPVPLIPLSNQLWLPNPVAFPSQYQWQLLDLCTLAITVFKDFTSLPGLLACPIWAHAQCCHQGTIRLWICHYLSHKHSMAAHCFPKKHNLLSLTFQTFHVVAQTMFLSFPFVLCLKSNTMTLTLTFT